MKKSLRMWLGWLRGGTVLVKGDAYAIIRADLETMFEIASDMMDEGWSIWKAPRGS